MASRREAIKRALKKEHPVQFLKDVGHGLADTFSPNTGKGVAADTLEFGKRVAKGGASAFAFPLTGPVSLSNRFRKGVEQNLRSIKAGKEVPVKGSEDEEISGLQKKYGPITGSAISVGKGTAEGAAGAAGGRMLGQAYKAMEAKGFPVGAGIKDVKGVDTAKFHRDLQRSGEKKMADDLLRALDNGDEDAVFDVITHAEKVGLKTDNLKLVESASAVRKQLVRGGVTHPPPYNSDFTRAQAKKITSWFDGYEDIAPKELLEKYRDQALATGVESGARTVHRNFVRALNRFQDKGGSFSDIAESVKGEAKSTVKKGNVPPPSPKVSPYKGDLSDDIIAFESGELGQDQVVKLFQHLVDTGQAWTLQGFYGRAARALIEKGLVVVKGLKGKK